MYLWKNSSQLGLKDKGSSDTLPGGGGAGARNEHQRRVKTELRLLKQKSQVSL